MYASHCISSEIWLSTAQLYRRQSAIWSGLQPHLPPIFLCIDSSLLQYFRTSQLYEYEFDFDWSVLGEFIVDTSSDLPDICRKMKVIQRWQMVSSSYDLGGILQYVGSVCIWQCPKDQTASTGDNSSALDRWWSSFLAFVSTSWISGIWSYF